jgi:hypothetical protein
LPRPEDDGDHNLGKIGGHPASRCARGKRLRPKKRPCGSPTVPAPSLYAQMSRFVVANSATASIMPVQVPDYGMVAPMELY